MVPKQFSLVQVATILPHELSALGDVEIIDVRSPEEFAQARAKGAVNHPLDDLDPKAIMEAREDTTKPLYMICAVGMRSHFACQQFIAAGYDNVVNVEGGTELWLHQGLPAESA